MNRQYNTLLESIEKEISIVLPKFSNKEWIYSAVGGIETVIDIESADNINKPAHELIFRGGKRWRPMVLALTTGAFSRNISKAIKLAPFVELIHNGTLLIDDIEDNAIERRGEKAIHLIYGEDMAINSGNHLYFMPTMLIDDLVVDDTTKLRIYKSYTHNMRRLHFGQGLDIQWHNSLSKIPTVEQYIQMCKFKTGCLASMSGELGAILAGINEIKTEQIRIIWEDIGVAFQILDDIKNITTGNPGKLRGDDIVEGKKSLPVILHCNKNDSSLLIKNISKAKTKGIVKGKKYVENAITIMEKSGAIVESTKISLELLNSSIDKLKEYYPECEEKVIILEIVNNFIEKVKI